MITNRKRFVAIAILCLSALGTSGGTDAWIVRKDGTGPAKIGMTLAQLKTALNQRLSEQESSNESCFYVRVPDRKHVSFMFVDGKLVRVDVDAAGIATSTGLQVGASESQVRKVYGSRMKVSPHKYVDTGHYLTVRLGNRSRGIRFETNNGKITKFYAGTYEAIQYVEGCE